MLESTYIQAKSLITTYRESIPVSSITERADNYEILKTALLNIGVSSVDEVIVYERQITDASLFKYKDGYVSTREIRIVDKVGDIKDQAELRKLDKIPDTIYYSFYKNNGIQVPFSGNTLGINLRYCSDNKIEIIPSPFGSLSHIPNKETLLHRSGDPASFLLVGPGVFKFHAVLKEVVGLNVGWPLKVLKNILTYNGITNLYEYGKHTLFYNTMKIGAASSIRTYDGLTTFSGMFSFAFDKTPFIDAFGDSSFLTSFSSVHSLTGITLSESQILAGLENTVALFVGSITKGTHTSDELAISDKDKIP